MTQDTAYNVPVEKIEDDFRRLQSLKKETRKDKEEKERADVELSTKSSKKQKLNKRELTKSLNKEEEIKAEKELSEKPRKVFTSKIKTEKNLADDEDLSDDL